MHKKILCYGNIEHNQRLLVDNWDDHAPPHFHAKYVEYEITVNIHTGVVEGKFPKRALRHVLEWYELHKDELIHDWELCQN